MHGMYHIALLGPSLWDGLSPSQQERLRSIIRGPTGPQSIILQPGDVSDVTCDVSDLTCYVSDISCDVSDVTCDVSDVTCY